MSRNGADWAVESAHFEGVPVAYAMCDPRNDTLWACLDHGHWGGKLHRSRDLGKSWERSKRRNTPKARLPTRFHGARSNQLYLDD